MRHTCEAGHDYAEGHPVGKEDPRRVGGFGVVALEGSGEDCNLVLLLGKRCERGGQKMPSFGALARRLLESYCVGA